MSGWYQSREFENGDETNLFYYMLTVLRTLRYTCTCPRVFLGRQTIVEYFLIKFFRSDKPGLVDKYLLIQ